MSFEHRILRPDGNERLVFQQAEARLDDDGKLVRIFGVIHDITERKELSARLDKLSQNIPGFIYQYHLRPDGSSCLPYASRGIYDVYGVHPEQVREDAAPVFSIVHPDDLERVAEGIDASARNLSTWKDEYRVQHPVKGEIWIEGHATPERLPDGGTLWHGYLSDITDRKRSDDHIRELALFDPLTCLANRRLLMDRLDHALALARRRRSFGAVLMIDLDNFKTVNDTQGHGVGDLLLIEVGNRLKGCIRTTDTIARIGGDEFVIILEDLGQQESSARGRGLELAETILGIINQPYLLAASQFSHHVGASIGITLFDATEVSVEELLKQSDIAMFEAKDAGRNCIRFFTEQRQVKINSHSAILHELRRGLENQELSLFYQPQFSSSGKLIGAEALVRWLPPGKEMVSPSVFIPIAEETDLIQLVGDWVFKTACNHLRVLMWQGVCDEFSLSINISARQFSDVGFLGKVRSAITQSGVLSRQLRLELTESSLIRDPASALKILSGLRALGLRIELDDFGTGYSSLTSLKMLPLDTLKLDRTLVRDLDTEVSSQSIVRAAIAMAKALSLSTVAEGVETAEQHEFLVNEGCDRFQGFLYSKPLPFAEFVDLVKSPARHFVRTPDLQQVPFSRHQTTTSTPT